MAAVTPVEFEEWLASPTTTQFKKKIKADIEYMKDLLVYCEADQLNNIQGRCQAAQNIIDMKYEDLFE